MNDIWKPPVMQGACNSNSLADFNLLTLDATSHDVSISD